MSKSFLLLLIGCLTAASGCGGSESNPVTVKGHISWKKKPLPTGQIVFVNPESGATYTGEVREGHFEVKNYKFNGLPPGRYQIEILPGCGTCPSDSTSGNVQSDSPVKPVVFELPSKYHRVSTSGLTAEVKPRVPLEIQFDLE